MTNMITNAGDDEIPPGIGAEGTRVSCCVMIGIELWRREFLRIKTPLNGCLTPKRMGAEGRTKRDGVPLQWTKTRPPPRMASSMNPLALYRTRSFNRTRVDDWTPGYTHAGKYRMRFCSSESARSTTRYPKRSGKRGLTEKASFASRMQTL